MAISNSIPRLGAVILLAGFLPACSTITTGSTQSVSVMTEPPGAACALQREGTTVGVVNPTPGTVQIGKSVHDISVRCTKPGYAAGVTALPSQFQAMTLGNILLGGVIGIAVDAASGAMGKYAENVAVSLPPDSFSSEQGREQYFTGQVADTRRGFADRIAVIRGQCGADNRALCDGKVRDMEVERDAELARLDGLRRTAAVSS